MKTKLIVVFMAAIFSVGAFANPPGSGETNGAGCNENCGGGSGGNGGSGGQGGNGGSSSSTSVGVSTSISGAIAGSSSKATGGTANATGGESSANGGSATAGNGSVSNSVTTGNVRSISLGAAAVGSPAADTCVAYIAIGFGLVTTPVQFESCVALQQALVLDHFGLRDAAIARLCQLKEINATGICPQKSI